MHTDDMLSSLGSHSLAMQHPAPVETPQPYVCPTCDEQACVCWDYDAPPPDTLAADLLASLVLAQGKAIQKLKAQVSGLLARETV